MSNLLPTYEKTWLRRLYRRRFASLCLLAVMCLALVGIVLLSPSYLLLKSDQLVLTMKRDTLANFETSKIAQSLAATVRDINTRLMAFPAQPGVASPLIAGMLDPALRAKTKAIHLNEFSYEIEDKKTEVKIKISGTADSRGDLLNYVERLKGTGNFVNVTVPITSFIKDSNVTFTVNAGIPQK